MNSVFSHTFLGSTPITRLCSMTAIWVVFPFSKDSKAAAESWVSLPLSWGVTFLLSKWYLRGSSRVEADGEPPWKNLQPGVMGWDVHPRGGRHTSKSAVLWSRAVTGGINFSHADLKLVGLGTQPPKSLLLEQSHVYDVILYWWKAEKKGSVAW